MAEQTERGKVRLFPIAARASRLVWRAAPRDLVRTLACEVVVAGSLAAILIAGREVITRLTLDGGPADTTSMLGPVIALGIALLVSGVTQVVAQESRNLVSELTSRRVREEIVDIATSVDFQEYESAEFHDLLQRANTRAVQSTYQIVFGLISLFSMIATSIAIVAVLITSVPSVLPVLVLIAIPFAVAARTSARLAFKMSYELTTNDRLSGYLYGALTGKPVAKELRVFGLAVPLHRRWTNLYDERITRTRRLARQRTLLNGGAALAASALVAGVLLVLTDAAATGRISVADAAVAIVALQQLAVRIRSVTTATGGLRSAALFLDDFDLFRSMRGEEVHEPAQHALTPQVLRVEHVSFTYPGTDAVVLDDVSLEVQPGEIVALVGESGSGKTTLASLVAGLYRPTSGRITYGGVDIEELDRAEYRRSLAVVFQDFVRYAMSGRENITMSDLTRLDDAVGAAEAARKAGIADAIERLPVGYETMMSRDYEGGAELSVGQWQRMAVARAFFRDAPILVLDEPAAALDALAEQALFDRLTELVAGRSVLMISHRFSTVRLADRIVVMRHGRITESGTHDELMRLGGAYSELFTVQAKGYLRDD